MRSINSLPVVSVISALHAVGVSLLFAAALNGQTPLAISNTGFPPGAAGSAYSLVLAARGGTPPYTWSITGLPTGLNFNSSGLIFGTPTTGGRYQITVTVADSRNATVSQPFTLVISGPAAPGLAIATTSLGVATVGQNYTQTVTATGGTSPYTWSLISGSAPGLTFTPASASFSGIPTASGTYQFALQVTDTSQATATANLTLIVNPAALQITTVGPLFNGTAGTAYTPVTFAAQGGKQPYTWSILSGNIDGLTLSSAGTLSGIPQTAGTFAFVVQVADSGTPSATTSQSFSIVVNPPSLVITATTFPAGAVGVQYSQTSPVAVASGGTPPYTWSLISGAAPGLTFVPASVSLSGTPTAPGTFTLQLQVSDSAGLTASKSFNVTIAPAALNITTPLQLPNATLNTPYSQQLAAAGGSPPYTWSANGLPKGLTIDSATGLLSGTPTAAGSFPIIVITVRDNALTTAQNNFSLFVNLPAAPSFTISGLPATAGPTAQFPLQVTLDAPFAAPITGQLIIGFQAGTGLGDSTIQFSTGGKSANFNIPAGSTSATFVDANGIAVPQLQIQTGTVSGSISVSLANINAAGVDITPAPAPAIATQIAAAAPVITNVLVTSDGSGGCPKGQICIQVTGYATNREVTQATFTFSAAAGQTLQPSAASLTVDVGSLFTTWFAASAIGSQFIFNQPFTVQGSPAAVIPTGVTLTNRVGTTTANISSH